MPTSVRLDAKTEALLKRLAHRSGRTKSEVLREALIRFAETEAAGEQPNLPCEMIAELIGVATGGPTDLARRHKQAFRERMTGRKRT